MKSLLITGFDPFAHYTMNPSWEVVQALPGGQIAAGQKKRTIPKGMVLFFYLCNYAYEQAAGLAAQPPCLKELCDAQARLRRGVSKSMFTCFLTEDRIYDYAVKLVAVTFKRSIAAGSILEGQIAMLEGVKRRTSMCQAFYRTFLIRERYIVPVSSNFLTQISHGTSTKCRKTRAKLRIYSI